MTYPTKKLGEVIELHYGKGIPKHDRKPLGKYPVYGANGILDHSDKYLVEGEAIIVGRKGSAGEVTRVSGKFWPSDVTYYVLGNSKINIDYLFHALKNLNLQRLAVGVKPGINRNRVYELEILLPPLSEQKKIVAKLEGLLGKIKEAKRLRAEAQSAAQNLLHSELHKIFEEGKKNVWEEKELGEIIKLQGGFAFKSTKYKMNGIPLIRIKNLRDEEVTLRNTVFIDKSEQESLKSFLLRENDILIAMSGATTGKLARVSVDKLPAFLNQRVGRFVIKDNKKIDAGFLWHFLKSLQDFVLLAAYGGAQPNVSPSKIEAIKIPLPPLAEQKKIVARLDSLSEKIKKLRTYQSQTRSDFTVLEQSILSKSFQHSCLPVSGGRI